MQRRLPEYLGVPIDTPDILVDSRRLETPLVQGISNAGQEAIEDQIVNQIASIIEKANKPCVLVDLLVRRFGITDVVRDSIEMCCILVS